MQQALAGKPEHHMAEPPGIISVRIDTKTGMLAGPNDPNSMFEYFTEQTAPTTAQAQSNPGEASAGAASSGNGSDHLF